MIFVLLLYNSCLVYSTARRRRSRKEEKPTKAFSVNIDIVKKKDYLRKYKVFNIFSATGKQSVVTVVNSIKQKSMEINFNLKNNNNDNLNKKSVYYQHLNNNNKITLNRNCGKVPCSL